MSIWNPINHLYFCSASGIKSPALPQAQYVGGNFIMTNIHTKIRYFYKVIFPFLVFTIGCNSNSETNPITTTTKTNYSLELTRFYDRIKMKNCDHLLLYDVKYRDSLDYYVALLFKDSGLEKYSLMFNTHDLSITKDSSNYNDNNFTNSIKELLPRLRHERMYSNEITDQNGHISQGVKNYKIKYKLCLIGDNYILDSGYFTDADFFEKVQIYREDKEYSIINTKLNDNLNCSWYRLLNLIRAIP